MASQSVLLVVDDEESIRQMLALSLPQDRFTVLFAASGQEAIAIAQAQHIDLVLLDVQMPDMDGPHTLRDLRAIHPATPCCFMTGHAAHYTGAELLDMGETVVLLKPFSLENLCTILEGMVG